jgi:hypothetical protein
LGKVDCVGLKKTFCADADAGGVMFHGGDCCWGCWMGKFAAMAFVARMYAGTAVIDVGSAGAISRNC